MKSKIQFYEIHESYTIFIFRLVYKFVYLFKLTTTFLIIYSLMKLGTALARPMITLSAFKSIEQNHTLFDFETFINEENFIINSTSQIYRSKKDQYIRGKKLQVVSKYNAMNGDVPDFDHEMLFSVNVKEQDRKIQYVINKPENIGGQVTLKSSQLQNMSYICLNGHGRTNQVKTYPLHEGDIIKLGKTYLRVLQTHFTYGRVPELPQSIQGSSSKDNIHNQVSGSAAKVCRICLMESDQQEQVISPCKCKGSCEFVHLNCLKTWLQSKVTTTLNSRLVTTYHLSKFQCQICKTPLPNKIEILGKKQFFVEFRKPDEPYIILQKIESQSKEKSIFILTPKDLGVKIGRSNSIDLKINDQTMSRLHAIIEFQGQKFVLSDLGSKFGSLILLRQEVKFDRIMCVQLRNKVYKLEVVPSINTGAQASLG